MKQVTNTILMIRPVHFRMNEQTAVNNYYQEESDLSNKEANKFVKHLIDNWGENFKEKIKEKLFLIKNGKLKPEFPIPENKEELKSYLGIEKTSVDERREIRQRLRTIAKEDSSVYTAT